VPSSFGALFQTRFAKRDKLLARIFGIIGGDIVRIWAGCQAAPYRDVGRPTIRERGSSVGSTLDFTFEATNEGRLYVAELKCELEYQQYRYLTLTDASQTIIANLRSGSC
jgi:hypothetical protein